MRRCVQFHHQQGQHEQGSELKHDELENIGHQDLAAGRLKCLVPNALRRGGRLFGVYPSRKYLSVKVRTFLDFPAQDARLKGDEAA